MWLLALALLQAAPDPGPEALALGRKLAETGTLASVLPMMAANDREALVAEHPEWSDADKAALRETADAVSAQGIERLMDATGRAYAARLSVADLKALVAFNQSEAAKHWRAATPAAIIEAMQAVGAFDLKAETRKAFCAKAGKLCP